MTFRAGVRCCSGSGPNVAGSGEEADDARETSSLGSAPWPWRRRCPGPGCRRRHMGSAVGDCGLPIALGRVAARGDRAGASEGMRARSWRSLQVGSVAAPHNSLSASKKECENSRIIDEHVDDTSGDHERIKKEILRGSSETVLQIIMEKARRFLMI